MDLAITAGILLFLGSTQKEQAPKQKPTPSDLVISQGPTTKEDLKRVNKTDRAKREEALEAIALENNLFPGTSRATRPFRRDILRERLEVEHDNTTPLIQNVRQTSKMRERLSQHRTHQKKTDLLDAKGRLVESFSTGAEAPGHIARSERMTEIRTENRQAIAHRVLLPKTRKRDDVTSGRILALSVPPHQRIGLNKETAPELTVFRSENYTTRTTLQGQFPRPTALPEKVDKATREHIIQDFRLDVPGGYWREPMQRNMELHKHPDRSDPYLAARRPNPTAASGRQEDPLRGMESSQVKNKTENTMQESKVYYYSSENRNARPFNQEESSRPQHKIENVQLPTYPTATFRDIHRPEDVIRGDKGGQKMLPENRDPQVQSARTILPIRTVPDHAPERQGHRDSSV